MYNRVLCFVVATGLVLFTGCQRRCYEEKTFENGIHRHDDRDVVRMPTHKDRRGDLPTQHRYRSNRAAKEDRIRRRMRRREWDMLEAF